MKKLCFSFLFTALALVLLLNASAAEHEYVLDYAEVLSETDADALEQTMKDTSDAIGFRIRAVTEARMSGADAEQTADGYYNVLNDNGAGYEPGILLYISYEPREYYVTASNNVFDTDMIDSLKNAFLPYLREDDSCGALEVYTQTVRTLVVARHGEAPWFPTDPYASADAPKGDYAPLDGTYDCDPYAPAPDYTHMGNGYSGASYGNSFPYDPLTVFAVVIVLPLIIALFLTWLKVKQMNNVARKTTADAFVDSNSLHLTQSREVFLYSTVTSTPKPKNDPPSHHGSNHGGGHSGGFSGGHGASGRVGGGGRF